MFRGKNPKGTWLINGFRRCAIGSFVLMMSLFLLYGATEVINFIAANDVTSEEVMGDKGKILFEEKELGEKSHAIESSEVDVVDSEIQIDDKFDEQSTSLDQHVHIEDSIEDGQQEDDIDEEELEGQEAIEGSDVQTQEEIEVLNEAFEGEASKEFVEIPVHGKYTLSITDDMIEGLEDVVAEQGLNPVKIIGEYIKGLEIKQRLQLINFTLEKASQIDIQAVWELVANGIDAQDIIEIQALIEDHFTAEEVDMLYEQYQQYASSQEDALQE